MGSIHHLLPAMGLCKKLNSKMFKSFDLLALVEMMCRGIQLSSCLAIY